MKEIRKYYKHKNCLHEGYIKDHNISREYIDFNKSYVLIKRDNNDKLIDLTNPITWIKKPYKEFFYCKCPNLIGDGTNHTFENCHHYQRSQYKKLQNGEILSRHERN